MSFVNYHTKEINCKIVYYGPGLGGKTTNIQYIYQRTHSNNKGKMVTLNTENERTLFFDFLPLDLGQIRGFKTRFHLYTVPGQVFYEASRKLILRGVDGIVFVADSQVEKMQANIESLEGLRENLKDQGYDINRIPMVLQWNKRDLPNVVPESELDKKLNLYSSPAFSSVATTGEGVFETLKAVSKLVLLNIKGGLEVTQGEQNGAY
jgi:signal recognition particle receptor subunit beta